MKKLLFQFTILVAAFFVMWVSLSALPLEQWFRVKELKKKQESEFNNLMYRAYAANGTEIISNDVHQVMNRLKKRLCIANKLDTVSIHIHVFEDEEINAFAIPGGHIIVNTALIKTCDNGDMLAGVVAHEMGHLENGHITKRIAREMGLSAVLMIGGDNLGMIKQILKTLSSSKFDREQETEADVTGILYLQQAGIDPKQLAHFFRELSEKKEFPEALKWLSTHPMLKERAELILKKHFDAVDYTPAIDSIDWAMLKRIT